MAAAAAPAATPAAASNQIPICLIMLGRQGSGKGTQSVRLCEKFNLVHVSTGDVLREISQSSSPLGVKVKQLLDSGELVSDEVICEILADRVSQPDVQANGVLLDGFPRTVGQAESLVDIVGAVHGVLNLDVPIAEATQRMLERNRTDDTEESIARRLALYEEQTEPLLSWYEQASVVKAVDGLGTEDEVFERVAAAAQEIFEAGGLA